MQRSFVKTIIDRAVVTTSATNTGKITLFIKPDPVVLKQFTSPEFINQNANSMKFIISNDTIIIERDIVITKGNQLTKYNVGHRGLMTMTENNHLIVRAFALAHKYKEVYERTGNLHEVMKTEKTSWRSLYRYLNLAYLSPKVINDVMSGKIQCSVDDLFKMTQTL